MLRGAPALYVALMHRRVSRVYGHLKLLEMEMAEGKVADPGRGAYADSTRSTRVRAGCRPARAYVSMVYTLRQHIQLIRDRLSHKP